MVIRLIFFLLGLGGGDWKCFFYGLGDFVLVVWCGGGLCDVWCVMCGV